jgi:hypothetical protein
MTRLRFEAPLAWIMVASLAAAPACDALPGAEGSPDPGIPESREYGDLVSLFKEWREFQEPEVIDGVPIYTAEAMAAQFEELDRWQARLQAIDPSGWPVSEQVDYHLVRAEMNGLEFAHRALRPWARMPSFYKVILPGETDVPVREGQVMHRTLRLYLYELPLSARRLEDLRDRLRAIPAILDQARENLTEDARDLWYLGIRVKEAESRALASYAEAAAEHHPDLVEDIVRARGAVDRFRDWLEEELPTKTGPSGVGIEAYSWHLKHVQLVPFTWEEQVALVRRQLERAWAYLALAENRNRNHPALEKVATEEEYSRQYRQAVRDFIRFLDEEGILTLSSFEEESLMAREGTFTPSDRPREFFTQVNYRDLRPMRAHGTHWFDLARMEAEPHPSPIRRIPLLYNIWASRAEGLATGFEEMVMEAGFLDAPRVRELVWVLLAQRGARALAELEMHANRMTLDEAAEFIVARTPHDWLTLDGQTVWREGQLYLEQPSYGTSYVVGKIHLDRTLADRRRQLGADFSLRRFMDEFHAAGMIPVSLIRWEMTGLEDEIERLRGEP